MGMFGKKRMEEDTPYGKVSAEVITFEEWCGMKGYSLERKSAGDEAWPAGGKAWRGERNVAEWVDDLKRDGYMIERTYMTVLSDGLHVTGPKIETDEQMERRINTYRFEYAKAVQDARMMFKKVFGNENTGKN